MNDAYPLRPFRVHDPRLIAEVIRRFPLAVVISGDAGSHETSLLPLLMDERGDGERELIGHLDRNNPQAALLVPGARVSFVFQGPNAYASPDLYPDRHLPGWLYVMAKGRGTVIERLDDAAAADALVAATTRFGAPDQAFGLRADDERIPRLIGGIVPFRVRIDTLSCIAKLAQDKGPEHADIASRFLASRSAEEPIDLFLELLEEGRIPD